jgi:hypothetical protein
MKNILGIHFGLVTGGFQINLIAFSIVELD